MLDRPYGEIWQTSSRKRDPGISGGRIQNFEDHPADDPAGPRALMVETRFSSPAFSAREPLQCPDPGLKILIAPFHLLQRVAPHGAPAPVLTNRRALQIHFISRFVA
jgi:hypothetical protein